MAVVYYIYTYVDKVRVKYILGISDGMEVD